MGRLWEITEAAAGAKDEKPRKQMDFNSIKGRACETLTLNKFIS